MGGPPGGRRLLDWPAGPAVSDMTVGGATLGLVNGSQRLRTGVSVMTVKRERYAGAS